jgi:hypothetical protein
VKLRGLLLASLLAIGCEEEKKVIYSERVAILPDASGLLVKEIRSDAQGKPILSLLVSKGGVEREVTTLAMGGLSDIKFRSTVRGDTLVLFHSAAGLEGRLDTAQFASLGFPVRLVRLDEVHWLTSGTEEGNAIFYAPGKWKAYLELTRRE